MIKSHLEVLLSHMTQASESCWRMAHSADGHRVAGDIDRRGEIKKGEREREKKKVKMLQLKINLSQMVCMWQSDQWDASGLISWSTDSMITRPRLNG